MTDEFVSDGKLKCALSHFLFPVLIHHKYIHTPITNDKKNITN